jgi:hypothetical protein
MYLWPILGFAILIGSMHKWLKKITTRSIGFIGSRYFFWGVIALFVFQALWVALSFRYPMIYDERYHFGLIDYFSNQWLPWINDQSTKLDTFSALERSPYLLYHYLMSFPLRIVKSFTSDVMLQIIALRIINIGLFSAGLFVFRHLFNKKMQIKPVFTNITLLFFVLLPSASLVAATINYDNLILLITAVYVTIGVGIISRNKLLWHDYGLFVLFGMLGALVKVSFIPILVAGLIFIAVHQSIKYKSKIIKNIVKSFKRSTLAMRIAVLIPLIVVGLFFMERFGVNVVYYHSLSPSCEVLLSEDRCNTNGINLRASNLLDTIDERTPMQYPQYATEWVSRMLYYSMWTGSSLSGGGRELANPMPVAYTVIFILMVVSVVTFMYKFDILKKNIGFWFLFSVTCFYVIILYGSNSMEYFKYYQLVGIQGRYLLNLLPIVMLFSILGINYVMKNKYTLKFLLLTAVFITYVNGAGVITHIMRSSDNWYWDNQSIKQVNSKARGLLGPLILEQWYKSTSGRK